MSFTPVGHRNSSASFHNNMIANNFNLEMAHNRNYSMDQQMYPQEQFLQNPILYNGQGNSWQHQPPMTTGVVSANSFSISEGYQPDLNESWPNPHHMQQQY